MESNPITKSFISMKFYDFNNIYISVRTSTIDYNLDLETHINKVSINKHTKVDYMGLDQVHYYNNYDDYLIGIIIIQVIIT